MVTSYEPLLRFRDDVFPLDQKIKEQLSKNPDSKEYLIGTEIKL